MLNVIKLLRQRTFLGAKQLKHDPIRLLTAIAGITFADVLIFMQLGFADALFTTNTQYPRILEADLVLVSTQAQSFGDLRTFPRRRLLQALDVPSVVAADPLYVASVQWRNPQTQDRTSMLLLGHSPERAALTLPEINQQLDLIRLPDTVLFDRASRGSYDEVVAQLEQGEQVVTEAGRRTITISGMFQMGASFADDGALITSDQNFLRLFPNRDGGAVSLGLVQIQPGVDPDQVQAALAAHLPEDVQVFTRQSYIDFEVGYIQRNSPIGFVFGLGSMMGFTVGIVIVYQVLSTDVNSHLAEYATFKAMGYRNSYLLGVIFEEALILTVLGFAPAILISLGAYQLTAMATALPLTMPMGRVLLVLLLTFLMCNVSGAIATRRLQAADPADIF